MLNPKLLRQNLDFVLQQLERRGVKLDITEYQNLETERYRLQLATQESQTQLNTKSKSIGKAKSEGKDIAPLLTEISE